MNEQKLIDEIKKLAQQQDIITGFFNGREFVAEGGATYPFDSLILTNSQPGEGFIVKKDDKWLCVVGNGVQVTRTQIITDKRKKRKPEENKYYPFKVLFSVKELDPIDETKEVLAFYLGGDRKKPKRLFEIKPNFDIQFVNVQTTSLYNYGKKYKILVLYYDNNRLPNGGFYASFHIIIATESKIEKIDVLTDLPRYNEFYPVLPDICLGDGKYMSGNYFPAHGIDESFSNGSYCNYTRGGVYYLFESTPPFQISGQSKEVATGTYPNDEYCHINSRQGNYQRQATTVSCFIQDFDFTINANNYVEQGSYKDIPSPVISERSRNFLAQHGNSVNSLSDSQVYSQGYTSTDTTNFDLEGLREENVKVDIPIFYGKDAFLVQELEVNLKSNIYRDPDSSRQSGYIFINNITRSLYKNKIYLKKYGQESKIELNSDAKILIINSSQEITLIENQVSVFSTTSHSVFVEDGTRNQLASIVNYYAGKVVTVAKKQNNKYFLATGTIQNLEFTVSNENNYYNFTGIFKVYVLINSIKEKEYISFASDKGLMFTATKTIDILSILYHLLDRHRGSASGVTVFYYPRSIIIYGHYVNQFIEILGSPKLEREKYINRYLCELINLSATKNYNNYDFFSYNAILEKNIIYCPESLTDFNDIKSQKNRKFTKYANRYEITPEGNVEYKDPAKGECFSLGFPGCTVRAVSYYPKASK